MGTSTLPVGLSIRAATPADLAVVLHHREQMFRDMGFTDERALATAMALSRPFFEEGLREGTYRGWLVIDERGAAAAGGGIVLLHHHPSPRDPRERRPVAVNVYTEPQYRRQGLARHLMQTMIVWARSAGFRALYLHASKDGLALYEDLGFVPTNEMGLAL